MNSVQPIPYGKYQHYRTEKLYEVVGVALHSETHEEMVIYKALYQCDKFGDNQVWVRPKTMFLEFIDHNGRSVPRFKWINE
jgi:hypothetical protein